VVSGALALFFGVLGALAIEDRAAPAAQPVAAAPPPRRVLVRRVIETRIVVHVSRRAKAPPESAPATAASPAPAPPAPAPAPAPAPLTTRSS
jgi:2-oxoglutarate dehydrogenase E2 component (dihydrolipoamide succinyltransferase)